jgi:membrane-bound ClpP family serine protease
MNTLVWVLALLLIGLAVMVLEVFVPSGGVLGFLSVVAILAAIVMAFVQQGMAFGLAVAGVAFVAVPAVLALAFRWFPDTPLGRRVLPPPPEPDEVLPDAERRRAVRGLVGRRGRTTSELVPWGTVEVDGVRCDAMSESGPIPPDSLVEVTGVQGAAVVVRTAVEPAAESAGGGSPALGEVGGVVPKASPGAEKPALSPTLEDFDFDALEPPAA